MLRPGNMPKPWSTLPSAEAPTPEEFTNSAETCVVTHALKHVPTETCVVTHMDRRNFFSSAWPTMRIAIHGRRKPPQLLLCTRLVCACCLYRLAQLPGDGNTC